MTPAERAKEILDSNPSCPQCGAATVRARDFVRCLNCGHEENWWCVLHRRITAALTVPANYMRDEHLVDRKVLGTLPKTADGCVCGSNAHVYHPDSISGEKLGVYDFDNVTVPTKRDRGNFIAESFNCDVSECYSTREAALSAKNGGGE